MLKILILEDEEPAANRLLKMIKEAEPEIELLDSIVSVSSAINWFRKHEEPDLVFSDIQLADGSSFEIFKEIKLKCPVIFITAYDQYAIDAFKLNSIDYLLKPIKKEELVAAINKFKTLRSGAANLPMDITKLLKAYTTQANAHKSRFIVRYGEHIKTIQVEEIAYFNTEDKVNFLTTFDGRRYVIDFNLDSLESMLEPRLFFRINRQFIVCINAITEMFTYTKSRVLIKLKPACKHETIVSTERAADFKVWLGDGS